MALFQVGHLGAAAGLGKPAQETVAGVCSGRHHRCGIAAVIALAGCAALTAVGIEFYIAVIIGNGRIVLAVQIHLCFRQTAHHQTVQEITAGSAPCRKSADKFIAKGSVYDSLIQLSFAFIQPAGAAVVGQGEHGVILTLGQLQIMLVYKSVNALIKVNQLFCQQLLRIADGNAVFLIAVHLVRRAGSTITNGPLGIVPSRDGSEAFQLFDEFHARVADLHVHSTGLQRQDDADAQTQNKAQNGANRALDHKHLLLSDRLLACIISKVRQYCNLFSSFFCF